MLPLSSVNAADVDTNETKFHREAAMAHPNGLLRHTLIAAIFLGLAGCRTAQTGPAAFRPARTILPADRIELPATFVGNFPLIEVQINGVGPFQLLLDSGSSGLLLSARTAKLAKVNPRPGSVHTGPVLGGQGVLQTTGAHVKHVTAGRLSLQDMPAFISSAETITTDASLHYDGILGFSALYDVVLEIDYPNRRVAAVRPGAEKFPRDRVVPLLPVSYKLFANFEIGGKTSRVFIDTGDDGDFEVSHLDDFPLLFPKQKADGVAGSGLGGRLRRPEWGQLDGVIRLGPVTWENPRLFSRSEKRTSVGCGALEMWKVIFDQRARLLYFLGDPTTVSTTKQAPNPHYKFGFDSEPHQDGIRLRAVDSGDAFERAGLRVDDVISTVDGHPVMDWNDGRLPRAVLQKARVKVVGTRGGKPFEVILVQGPDGE